MASSSPTPQLTNLTITNSQPAQPPPTTQDTPNDPSPPPTLPLNLTTHLTTWLITSAPSVLQFWIGATWRPWARFDLYLHLLHTLPSPLYLLNHSLTSIWPTSPSEELDIHIEPSDPSLSQIGIILCCERVSENEGSFERFRAEMDGDIERVKGLGGAEGWHEGLRVFVVGVSGPVMGENEDAEWRCRPEPVKVEVAEGEVCMWVYEIPGEEDGGKGGGEGKGKANGRNS